MANEHEINQIWPRIGTLEKTIDHCCRDRIVWHSFIRIVQGERQGMSNDQIGRVVSDWTSNAMTGAAVRGKPFTVKFALPFNSAIYYPDRSDAENISRYFSNSFMIKTVPAGKNAEFKQCFFTNGVGQQFGIIGTSLRLGRPTGAVYVQTGPTHRSEHYPCESGSFTFLASPATTTPIPYTTSNGYYKVYYDEQNRICVDVIRLDQFAANESETFFITQWVKR